MEREIEYGGYVIRACPQQLDAPMRWSIAVDIELHKSGKVIANEYEAEETRNSEEEAVESSLVFGRQIVDGRYPDHKPPILEPNGDNGTRVEGPS